MLIDRARCHHFPTLCLVEKVHPPAHSLETLTEWRGVGYGPCMDRWAVDATIVPSLEYLRNTVTAQVSDRDNRCAARRGTKPSTYRWPIDGVSSVRRLVALHILINSFN